MKTLDRREIECKVRDVEGETYALALQADQPAHVAEDRVVAAFMQVAPYFPSLSNDLLKRKLAAAIRRRRGSTWLTEDEASPPIRVTVPEGLHQRLVDAVEEHQQNEPIGRRLRVLLAVAAAALLVVGAGLGIVRWNALAAARPAVAESYPIVNGKEIGVDGEFWMRFSRMPLGTPSITLEPAGAILDPPAWNGQTLLVDYRGLRLESTYTLTLSGAYRSQYGDVGHFTQQWRFTTESYPVVLSVGPVEGATDVFRNGQISVQFNERPPVLPTVTISPGDAIVQPGAWDGATWMIAYTGLKPLTIYQATVSVDYGAPKANIRRSWSFLTEPGAPPAGMPVLWYMPTYQSLTQQGQPQRIVAINWAGQFVGTMYQSQQPWQQSPDGSLLFAQAGTVTDRNGDTIPLQTNPDSTPVLADDDHSVCEIVSQPTGKNDGSTNAWLYVGQVADPLTRIAYVGQFAFRVNPGIVACSILANRAVVIDFGPGGVTAVQVWQLTTGRTLFQRSYSWPQITGVTSSHDGRYLAEDVSDRDSQGNVIGWTAVIRRTSDGVVVARLSDQRVVQFSWDDSRVLTAPPPSNSTRDEIDLLAWRTGKVLWRLPGGQVQLVNQQVSALAQPNGGALAVAIGTAQGPQGNYDQLWLVEADGSARLILNDTFWAPFLTGP